MDGIHSTQEGYEKCLQNLSGNLKRTPFEKKKVVDWIHTVQYRVQGQTFVNMVMNFRTPLKAGNILTNRAVISFSRRTIFFSRGSTVLEGPWPSHI
jgi:hypothetical protein